MTDFIVTIDRMTVDLFEFLLQSFWRTLGPTSPLRIIDKHGIETDGHIAIAGSNRDSEFLNPMKWRVKVIHRKYLTIFDLEEWQAEKFTLLGNITVLQRLSDQVKVFCMAEADRGWQDKFAEFLAQTLGVTARKDENDQSAALIFSAVQNARMEQDRQYWTDICRQAESSGNVKQYLADKDIPRATYYENKKKYGL